MTLAMFNQLLQDFAVLSGLLLLGTLIRAKVRLVQKIFLPAAVIGGLIGLLLGPIVMKEVALLPIPQRVLDDVIFLPAILIIPVLASIPLGVGMSKQRGVKVDNSGILPMILLAKASAFGMYALGLGVNLIFGVLMPELDIYPSFGLELSFGFSGGHGAAGLVGNILNELGMPYWKTAQGITISAATVGVIGGIVLGMIMINVFARKGQITHLADPSAIPRELRQGYYPRENEQEEVCKETTHPSSIDSLTFHAALIFGCSGLAFGMSSLAKAYKIPLLSHFSPWLYALIISLLINQVIKKTGLGFLIDLKTKTKFVSLLIDFSIVAAIISMPLKAVMEYAVPMVVMFSVAFIFVYCVFFIIAKWIFKDFWFERSIALFGQQTGITLTGILLLRICDPESKTPVLRDFSLAYAISTIVTYALLIPMINLMHNTFAMLVAAFSVFTVALLSAAVYAKKENSIGIADKMVAPTD